MRDVRQVAMQTAQRSILPESVLSTLVTHIRAPHANDVRLYARVVVAEADLPRLPLPL